MHEMKPLDELWRRLRFFFHRERFSAELDEEMRLHADLRAGCPDRACNSTGYTRLLRNGISSGASYIELWPRDALGFSKTVAKNPIGGRGP